MCGQALPDYANLSVCLTQQFANHQNITVRAFSSFSKGWFIYVCFTVSKLLSSKCSKEEGFRPMSCIVSMKALGENNTGKIWAHFNFYLRFIYLDISTSHQKILVLSEQSMTFLSLYISFTSACAKKCLIINKKFNLLLIPPHIFAISSRISKVFCPIIDLVFIGSWNLGKFVNLKKKKKNQELDRH